MKMTKLASFISLCSLGFMASSVALSADLNVDVNAPVNPNPEWASSQPKTQEDISEADVNFMTAMLEKARIGGEISANEISAIDAKKHILFKHIFEQEQLNDLRDYLKGMEAEQSKRQAIDGQYPFTPDEILRIRQLAKAIEEAENKPIADIEFNIKTVELDPNARNLIEVHISKGYSSSITFFDEIGTPWPIKGSIIGDEETFEIEPFGESTHIGIFKAKQSFKQSNAIVNLENFNMPVIVKLISSDKVVDARVGVRIPTFGPSNRDQKVSRSTGVATDDRMLSVLNGDGLSNSKEYSLEGAEGSVWYQDGELIIRTKSELVIPPYREVLRSPTGYNVFRIPAVTNLSFTQDGEMVSAKVVESYSLDLKRKKTIFD